MRFIKWFLLITFLPGFLGCSNLNPTYTITPTPKQSLVTPIFSPTPKKFITESFILTKTPTSPVRITPTPSPTNQPIQTKSPNPVCPNHGNPVPRSSIQGINGTILYQIENQSGIFTLGGSSLERSYIPLPEASDNVIVGLSPNGKSLAYAPKKYKSTLKRVFDGDKITLTGKIVFETPSLTILTALGERINYEFQIKDLIYRSYQDWPVEWLKTIIRYPASYWINDDIIAVRLFYDDPIDPYSRGYSPIKMFKTTVEGSWIDGPLKKLNRLDDGEVGFSPDMSRVLYEAKNGDFSSGIVLRDLEKNINLWSDPDFSPSVIVRWAFNSSMVAVGNKLIGRDDRILIISRNGDQEIITDSTLTLDGFYLMDLSWSPDSRYLALITHRYSPFEQVDFLIYDSTKGQFVLNCPLISQQSFSRLFWSPDNQYIAFSGSDYDLPVEILNTETGEVYELVQNAVIIGWTDKFPLH